MTKLQLIVTIFLMSVLVTTCLTMAVHDDDHSENVDSKFRELLIQLYELEKEAFSASNNNINNISNNSKEDEHVPEQKTIKRQSNQIGCYGLNFYKSNRFSKNGFHISTNNNVYRELFTKKQRTTLSINIEKFQLLAPEPYWSTPQINRFHRIVMTLKEEISQLENPDNILKVKKTIASLLDLPIREGELSSNKRVSKKNGGAPVCKKAGRIDKETNTQHLCEQCQSTKTLTSNM